jgi:hypothetical protein
VGSGVVTDVELGTLARAGDMQAVAGLLERHRPSLYAAAISLLGNRADALDAVQDTNLSPSYDWPAARPRRRQAVVARRAAQRVSDAAQATA